MPYTDSHTAMAARPAEVDVLDSGGDRRRQHDAARLKSVLVGVAAGILTYAAVAQGPWAQGRSDLPTPRPVTAPVAVPRVPPGAVTGGAAKAPSPEPACRVPLRDARTDDSVCLGTADAASAWLAGLGAAHRSTAPGGHP